jgi:hypothetical protein
VALNEQRQIPPAPRRLSAETLKRIRRDVLLPRIFGMIWLGVFGTMLVVFLFLGDPLADYRISRSNETATGIVTDVTRQGRKNPYRIAYTFTDRDGAEHTGRSFSRSRRGLLTGNEVMIEYVPAEPRLSRIQGMRYCPIPLGTYVMALSFTVAGGAIWAFGVVKLGRMRRLCEQGAVTTGTVVAARWNRLFSMRTSFRTPRRFRYEVHYRFTDDRGLEREAVHRTYAVPDSLHLSEGDPITVLFDRANPARSLAAEALELQFGQ